MKILKARNLGGSEMGSSMILDAKGRPMKGSMLGRDADRQGVNSFAHLDPDNQPILDLKYHAFKHVSGPITVWGTWLLNTIELESALVLLPSTAFQRRAFKREERPTPCIVPTHNSWMWCESPIGDELQAAIMACEFALMLGLNPQKNHDIYRVLDAVRSHIPDLYTMPLCPKRDTISAGEVRFRIEDGTHIEQEVRHAI